MRNVMVLMLAAGTAMAAANNCPERPERSIAYSAMPADVCIPDGFKDVPVLYFDEFSWRQLLAMVWPAAPGKRGIADTTKTAGAPGSRVFETMKSMWEVFPEDGVAPIA